MFIHEFINPIPVVTPLGDGIAIYVKSNGIFEDDEWAVAMRDGGQVRHFISSHIKIWNNNTYSIIKK